MDLDHENATLVPYQAVTLEWFLLIHEMDSGIVHATTS